VYSVLYSSRLFFFFLPYYSPPPPLHSFPTRRSSDLLRWHDGGVSVAQGRVSLKAESVPSPAPPAHSIDQETRFRATLPLRGVQRSEEHTSELQSRENLVCRLLLEKKKIKT